MSSFWDEFKDLFKTQKRKDEEKSTELKSALEAEKSVTDKLEELEQQYQSSKDDNSAEIEKLFPSTLGLEKIEYSVDSDADVATRANKEIAADKTEKINDLNSGYEEKSSALKEKAIQAETEKNESEKQLAELYSELKSKQEKESIKRGVARGSILNSLIENLDDEKTSSVENVRQAYDKTVTAIDNRLNDLSAELNVALEELDVRTAAELNDRIAELKKERDKTVAGYVKYNNSIDEKERAYQAKREENLSEYLKKQDEETRAKEAKYGYSGEKLQNYSERYKLAYDFYMSLSENIAAEALNASPNMRYYLGNYYDKLMGQLQAREGTKKYF